MGNGRNGVKTRFPARRGGKSKRPKTPIPSFFAGQIFTPSHPRPVIGVALSCGGAKGLAHLGVIRVLVENGIVPDMIAGSSMGAYVGALWAKGYNPDEMEKMALEYSGILGALKLADPKLWPVRGLLKGRFIETGIRRRLKFAKFKELRTPLFISGTDLDMLETCWFHQGDVASAVRASCGLPGIFAPKKIKGKPYVDGGIAAPLPVEKLKQMGADLVIASNVMVPPEQHHKLGMHSKTLRQRFAKRHPILHFLNQTFNPFSFGSGLQVLDRCVRVGQARRLSKSLEEADVVINAYSFHSRWYEFYKPERFIALGNRAATEALPHTLKVIQSTTPNLSSLS
jgi:NTE family protein